MKICLNIVLFTFTLFCFTKNIHAQDSLQHAKWKRNHIKLGNSPIPLRLYVSYEHAIAKHFSIGTMGCYNGSESFHGYVGSLFSRFYFNKFNESGWFTELRGIYGHFSPITYTYYYPSGHPASIKVRIPDLPTIYLRAYRVVIKLIAPVISFLNFLVVFTMVKLPSEKMIYIFALL